MIFVTQNTGKYLLPCSKMYNNYNTITVIIIENTNIILITLFVYVMKNNFLKLAAFSIHNLLLAPIVFIKVKVNN